jgi:hypothetical protein
MERLFLMGPSRTKPWGGRGQSERAGEEEAPHILVDEVLVDVLLWAGVGEGVLGLHVDGEPHVLPHVVLRLDVLDEGDVGLLEHISGTAEGGRGAGRDLSMLHMKHLSRMSSSMASLSALISPKVSMMRPEMMACRTRLIRMMYVKLNTVPPSMPTT